MSIKRLSNNKYKITIELGYDALGNRRRKTETFHGTKTEANKREAELTKKFYHIGNTTNINDLTFEEYSKIFLAKHGDYVSLTTKYNYEKMLKRILPIIGNKKLNKINPLILDNMYQKLKIGVNGEVLGYHSMHGFYKLISVMFNQAIKWELVGQNPNLKATKPQKEKTERNYYDLQEVTTLLNCLENENIKYQALITLALDSGMRRSEICGLRWSDIDFDTHTVKIQRSLKVVDGVVDEGTTKTSKSKRTIVLSEITIELLKKYQSWQNDVIISMGSKWVNENRVFTNDIGKYMHPSTCGYVIRKLTKKYNLKPICFHGLRHTSASILIHKGINPKAVSDRLGHTTTNMTMEIYSHAFNSAMQESANIFDTVLKNA